MRTNHNKLVRDRIPEIIQAAGGRCEITTLTGSDYQQALRQKLIEEAQEAATADPPALISELADLLEVVDAVMTAYHISRDDVLAQQQHRRQERGGFEKCLWLLWSESG